MSVLRSSCLAHDDRLSIACTSRVAFLAEYVIYSRLRTTFNEHPSSQFPTTVRLHFEPPKMLQKHSQRECASWKHPVSGFRHQTPQLELASRQAGLSLRWTMYRDWVLPRDVENSLLSVPRRGRNSLEAHRGRCAQNSTKLILRSKLCHFQSDFQSLTAVDLLCSPSLGSPCRVLPRALVLVRFPLFDSLRCLL